MELTCENLEILNHSGCCANVQHNRLKHISRRRERTDLAKCEQQGDRARWRTAGWKASVGHVALKFGNHLRNEGADLEFNFRVSVARLHNRNTKFKFSIGGVLCRCTMATNITFD